MNEHLNIAESSEYTVPESLPRFITNTNEREYTHLLLPYAEARLKEKAKKFNVEVTESHINAIRRLTLSTSAGDIIKKHGEQMIRSNDAWEEKKLRLLFAAASVLIVLSADGGYAHSYSTEYKVNLEEYTPLIYINPFVANGAAITRKHEVLRIAIHEIEHAVNDVLGLYHIMGEAAWDEKEAERQENRVLSTQR